MKFVPKKLNDFFYNCVKSTIEYREENNVQRNDFMQLLMELKDKGRIEDPDDPTPIPDEELPGKPYLTYCLGKMKKKTVRSGHQIA